MAEGEGFEPSIRFPVYTLSKRAPSATRPPLLETRRTLPERAPLGKSIASRFRADIVGLRRAVLCRIRTQELLTIPNHTDSMRFLFLAGWALLLGAFAVAAAETIARTFPIETGWMISAGELWRALWPGSYVYAELRLGALTPWLWDPVISWVLAPPAWLLLGLPGVILAWTCRPSRNVTPMQEEELREHEASLFLYDELAREAREWARQTGEPVSEDDRRPNQDVIDLLEGEEEEDYDVIDPLPEFVKPPER
jgi:hypothetical protein